VIDTRERVLDVLDQVNATSLDPYSTLRSAYRQRRAAEIRHTGPAAPEAAGGTGFGAGLGVSVPALVPRLGSDSATPQQPQR